jgi:hypothetical protein
MQFLIVGRIVPGTEIEQVLPLVKPEAAKVWELYASDRLQAIHYIAADISHPGVSQSVIT